MINKMNDYITAALVVVYDTAFFLFREFHPKTIRYDALKWWHTKKRRWVRLNVPVIGNQGLHPGSVDFSPVEREIDYENLVPREGGFRDVNTHEQPTTPVPPSQPTDLAKMVEELAEIAFRSLEIRAPITKDDCQTWKEYVTAQRAAKVAYIAERLAPALTAHLSALQARAQDGDDFKQAVEEVLAKEAGESQTDAVEVLVRVLNKRDADLKQLQARAEAAESLQRQYFDKMNQINGWYNELIEVVGTGQFLVSSPATMEIRSQSVTLEARTPGGRTGET